MTPSIIAKNIKKLGAKFIAAVNYVDIDYRGYLGKGVVGVDRDGNHIFGDLPSTIRLGVVITNNLKLWLMSTRGDYYRRVDTGGFFDNIRRYPLTEDTVEVLTNDLSAAITSDFPEIEILALFITPDIVNRGWKIQLTVKDTITGVVAVLDSTMDID